ncbi:SGNH/GDSL hydrolase family protein [Pedobacter cryophilus]|uniref:SGNH/GDSL hydrolase family protein n=1 Tax=Pedobacter cryophilus TaxID=2571271 RepID=A0A4U1BX08_9SPHI|nr:SGNH/GDSL hydrolase family protein [Pedobacter cryophilus]TKB96884.1 SGNH/GDSL hydrolase family protein [Pedobacter cryophilus]
MNKLVLCFFTSVICLLCLVFRVDAQQSQKSSLIEASQAGASPLFFKVNNPNTPIISLGKRSYPLEFFLRGGLPNFIYKANKGDSLKLGFIGGSITKADDLYRTQIAKHLQKTFPKAKMIGLNTGVSGTGSDLGAFRVTTQLLAYQPDLVFIEFAVNGAFAPGVEGIIRQIRKHNSKTEICLLYTISEGQAEQYANGKISNNIKNLEKIAEHYQVPSVHFGASIGVMQQEGSLIWKGSGNSEKSKIVFSNDGLHPTKDGGNLYAAAIGRAFELIKMQKTNQKLISYELLSPLLNEDWEDAKMLDPKDFASFKGDWITINPDTTLTINKFKPWFPYVMKAAKPGSEFTFKFKGDVFGLFDIGGPEVGEIEIFVDEEKGADSLKFINNRFNKFCNDRYRGQYFKYKVPYGEHIVRVIISQNIPNKQQILGDSQLSDITVNPAKYNQSVIYLGKILIKGEPMSLKK